MQLFAPLEIEVYWHTDETAANEKLGLDEDPKLEDFDRRKMTFYSIDNMCPGYWNGDEESDCTYLWVGGEKWIVTEKYEAVKAKIHELQTSSDGK